MRAPAERDEEPGRAREASPEARLRPGPSVLEVTDSVASVKQRMQRVVLEPRPVAAKLCYGLLLYNDRHAAEGREPVRPRCSLALCVCESAQQTCWGMPVHRLVPRPPPPSLPGHIHPADVAFKFSCAGKALHVLQPAKGQGGKVLLPYCEGLEVLASSHTAAAATKPTGETRAAASGASRAARRGAPLTPPPGGLDLSDFGERWLKSANKIWARMQENLETVLGRR